MAEVSTEELLSAYGYTVTASLYVNEAAEVAVFVALDQSCWQPVVLKVTYVVTDNYYRKVNSFLNEAMAQRSLDHPNICRILRVFIFERGIVIVLEPLRQDLSKLISERSKWPGQPFAEAEAWTLLHAMASALEFAQRKGVSHRDIKPQNILIDKDGVYKLCDFGSAKEVDLMSSQLHSMVGSPLFLSPQLRFRMFENSQGRYSSKAAYDPFKSDVYSLALTLLYFIRCAPPRELVAIDNLLAITTNLLASLSVSAALKEVLGHMLQPDEAFRPDFIQLKQILDAQPVQPAPVVSPVPVQVSGARRPQSVSLPRLCEDTLRCHCTNPLPGNYFITSCGHACCSKKCYEALSHVRPCPICPRS